MIPIKTLVSIDRDCSMPIYLQIAQSINKQIQKGVIKSGTRLPGSRVMADLLDVHRKTINKAIEELEAQGWIEVIPYKGAFVMQCLPEVRAQSLLKNKIGAQKDDVGFPFYTSSVLIPAIGDKLHLGFTDGSPDVRLAPIDELGRAYTRNLRRLPAKKMLSYDDPAGVDALRITLAKEFNQTKGLNINAQNILITRGSQMGIYLAGKVLFQPGDIAVVGETNYFVANMTFLEMGAKLKYIPVDEEGINVDAIESICRKQKIKAVYVTSHHHHPTTVTLSPERRIRLLALAQQYGFAIIEDDYDYDFHYESSPILPLASSDRKGVVAYVGSFSKSIAPAFRIGFVVAPSNLINEMAKLRRYIDRQGDVLLERTIAIMLEEGEVRRHIRKALKIYHQRRDFFCHLLKKELGDLVDFKIPEGGLAVWTTFDKKINLNELSLKAAEKKLMLEGSEYYNPLGKDLNSTRMGFASMNEKEMKQAMKILKTLI